jgi:hypothetical protein
MGAADGRISASPLTVDAARPPSARTHMSKKAFTGLILLIAALLVASVPALLTPASAGVEQAAIKVGLLQPPAAPPAPVFPKASKKDKPADGRLELRGYELEKDGDLRDTVDPLDRDAHGHARLTSGSRRVLLDGQRDRSSEAPPATSEDGVLLDITGCPVFREGTDVTALLAVVETQNLYARKVAGSDDPAACDTLLQQRIKDATAAATTSPLGAATDRDRNSIRRGSPSEMVVAFAEIQLLSQFMDDASLQDALAALDGTSPAAAAAGGSATATATGATGTAGAA